MSEIILINKMRYLEYGKKAPKGSRFKGIVTLQSLTGLVNYHAREDAKVQREEQNLLNYSSKIRGHHTLTNEGYLDTEEKRESFKNEIGNYFNKDGRICWDTIVSLPSYEVAQKHGLYTANDYTQIVERGLTKFFVNIGLDLNNVIYWIDHHNDTDNPHCHVGFMEKEPTITKGYFSQKKLDQLKKSITNQVLLRKEFSDTKRQSHIELLQQKDLLKKNVKETAIDIVKNADEEIATLIKNLYIQLDKKGRWQYNSIHIKEQRPLLDYIVEKVLISNDEIKQQRQQFNEKLLKLDFNLNQTTGSKKIQCMKKKMKN